MIVLCPNCQTRFNANSGPQTTPLQCPKCKANLAANQGSAQTAAPTSDKLFWLLGGGAALVLLLLLALGAFGFVWMNRRQADVYEIAGNNDAPYDASADQLPPPNPGQEASEPGHGKPAKSKPRKGGILPPLDGNPKQKKNTKKPAKAGRIALDQFQVQFLTSVAKGRRFAIIADRSGSMSRGGRRLQDPKTKKYVNDPKYRRSIDLLHDDLIMTVQSFKPGSSYYIAFFGSATAPMPFGDTWVEGGKDADKVAAWVKTVQPAGGTNPLPAFQRVFRLKPRPDVIFFMTDGSFSPSVASSVARLNGAKEKVTINTIQFQMFSGVAGYERYSRLLASYQFSPDVKVRLQRQAARSGPVGSRVHLEQIARRSGGSFTLFGPKATKTTTTPTVRKPRTLKAPVLARTGQISAKDKEYLYRRGCRYKIHKVFLKAGVNYEIDMVANFDAYLFLTDAKGKVLTKNDNGSAGRNSLLAYTPARDGTYRIIATTRMQRQFGPYVVTVIDGKL